MRNTPWPDGPRPLFIISNPFPYRITFTILGPEFQLTSGWTETKAPSAKFGGQPLDPGTAFEVYGQAATNIAYRYAVLWGLHTVDVLARPKWKIVTDEWCERLGIRPLLLPYGIAWSPSVPPLTQNERKPPLSKEDQTIRAEKNK